MGAFGLSPTEVQLAISMLIKLGVGALLAGLIGLERELRDHPAGIRTHILLILGVILFADASRGFGGGDPSRVAAQIVTGVGFLCAGTILRTGTDVKGLTTAASLWATSGIGVMVSLGGAFMAVAVAATVLSLITLHGVARVEKRFLKGSQSRTLIVKMEDRSGLIEVMEQISKRRGCTITSISIQQTTPEALVAIQIRGVVDRLVEEVLLLPGVRSAVWQY